MAQVAILCNHQRSVPKGHTGQMQKMEAKLLEQQTALDDLEDELKAARKGKPFKGGKTRPVDSCAPALPPSLLCFVRSESRAGPMIDLSRCFGSMGMNATVPAASSSVCGIGPLFKV